MKWKVISSIHNQFQLGITLTTALPPPPRHNLTCLDLTSLAQPLTLCHQLSGLSGLCWLLFFYHPQTSRQSTASSKASPLVLTGVPQALLAPELEPVSGVGLPSPGTAPRFLPTSAVITSACLSPHTLPPTPLQCVCWPFVSV